LFFCIGDPKPGWVKIGETDSQGFSHYKREGEEHPRTRRRGNGKQKNKQDETHRKKIDWLKESSGFISFLGREEGQLQILANSVGLPESVFSELNVGLRSVSDVAKMIPGPDEGGKYKVASLTQSVFTIPEVNNKGDVVGISTRTTPVFPGDDNKGFIYSGNRGYIVPNNFKTKPGPALIPEGFTDTAALTAAGLCAVGRANADSTAIGIADLFKDWPAGRDIIVLGENEEHKKGEIGAANFASELSAILKRPVKTALPPKGFKDVRAWFTSPDRSDVAWVDRGSDLLKHINEAAAVVAPKSGSELPKVEIFITKDNEKQVAEEIVKALSNDPEIYRRGSMLVSTSNYDNEIRTLDCDALRNYVAGVAKFRIKNSDGTSIPESPPQPIIRAIVSKGRFPDTRELDSYITHPFIGEDGTIIQENGYNEMHKVIIRIPDSLRIDVPQSPNRAQVDDAVEAISDIIQNFNFAKPGHRSAWFCALFTPVMRYAFRGLAPVFFIDAPDAGTGKGKLADCISWILFGKSFHNTTYTNEKSEMRKLITTILSSGTKVVLFDNIDQKFGNGVLNAALTAELWTDRLLTTNRSLSAANNVTWFATGNNCQVAPDMGRRMCHIKIQYEGDKPFNRGDFKYKNVLVHIAANRSKLLSAVLTIIRGWYAAGKPTFGNKPWGSFQEWSDHVREIVSFAGLPSNDETQEDMQESLDGERNDLRIFINGIDGMVKSNGGPMLAAEIVAKLSDIDLPPSRQGLKESAERLCDGRLTSYVLGNKLATFRDRAIGNRKLIRHRDNTGNRWCVVEVGAPAEIRAIDIDDLIASDAY
jgi:hypothetical protein